MTARIPREIAEAIHETKPLSDRLRAARLFNGEDQAALAATFDVSLGVLLDWEKGAPIPPEHRASVDSYIDDAVYVISGSPKMRRPWFTAKSVAGTMMALIMKGGPTRIAPLREGERALSWLVLPNFQRPAVWTLDQKIAFIESAWDGLPLGVWVYNRTPDMHSPYDGWLLDGQQRVTAIMEYVNDGFPVRGYLYSELMPVDHRIFNMISFACLETSLDDPSKLEDVYNRLAYGGTPHEPKGA